MHDLDLNDQVNAIGDFWLMLEQNNHTLGC